MSSAGWPGGMSAAAAPLPPLRQRCLRVVASALARHQCGACPGTGCGRADAGGLGAGAAALPQELRAELLLLLASWQLLDDSTCALLTGEDAEGVLAGAAAASFDGCARLGSASLARLLRPPLPLLRTLSLRGVARLSDADVAMLALSCPGLQQLDLAKCPRLTAAAVAALAAGPAAPALRSLSLSGCWQLSSLPGLQACSQLTALDLGGCWQLRDRTVRQVLAGTPLLEELTLSGCLRLSCGVLVTASLPPGAPAGNEAAAGPYGALNGDVGAAAGQGPALGGIGDGRQAQEHWIDDAAAGGEGGAAGGEGAPQQLRFPVRGLALQRLRCLDVSGTAAGDCLLLWLALRCCGRLQRLVASGSRCTGLGLAALLRAKRSLLHLQRCPAAGPATGADAAGAAAGTAAGESAAAGGGGGGGEDAAVLPLLELAAGGPAALGMAPAQQLLTHSELREVQGHWEAALGGHLELHPPSAPGRPPPPPLPFSLLSPPPDAACPRCLAACDGAAEAAARGGAPPAAASGDKWPPGSPAGVLASLGPAGMAQLQALDVSGASGAGEIVELAAAHCRSLQRLRAAGCTGLDDASLAPALRLLRRLRELDLSGCCGTRRSRPGSRFQRGKAPRLREGGVGDDALCLLGTAGGDQATQSAGLPPTPLPPSPPPPCEVAALNASGLSITDAVLLRCAALGSLSSLQLRGCKRLSDSGVLQVLSRCTQLARLDVAACSQITAAAMGCYTPFPGQGQRQQEQGQAGRQSLGPQPGGGAWGELPASEEGAAAAPEQEHQQHQLSGTAHCGSGGGEAWHGAQRAALSRFRTAVTTAAATRLQRAALPRQACTREALAWLAGQACGSDGSSRDGSSGGGAAALRGPDGLSPLLRLELASCESLAEADLAILAACCPRLKSLQLGGCGLAAGPGLCGALAACCAGLTRLALAAATYVGDAEVALLLRGLLGLQQLEVAGCRGVSGTPFRELCAEGDSGGGGGSLVLRTLRLDSAAALGDAAAAAAAACCPHLEVLSLRGCRLLTAAAVAAALRACANLRQLHLGGCQRISGPCTAFTGLHGGSGGGGIAVPGALTLVELPTSASRRAAEWRGALGSAKLVFRDGG